MAGNLRALRRRILTPSMTQTLLATRGFTEKSPAARERLETIGRIFLTGYGIAVEARDVPEIEAGLEAIEADVRGFAYEGAGMGVSMLDGLPGFGGGRFEGLLRGRGAAHSYMVNVGAGWAMARLPRLRWGRVRGSDALLRWLILDGYGFHQAYFKTAKYVHGQYREPAFPWPADGPRGHADKVIDQGIGRAMWFVGGADPGLVAAMIGKFAPERRGDLFAGAGLAATYAGAADKQELFDFWDLARPYRAEVAQGSAFAATARFEAGLSGEHTELAASVFCGTTVERAAAICRETRPEPPYAEGPDGTPAYERWRRAIAATLAADGRCEP